MNYYWKWFQIEILVKSYTTIQTNSTYVISTLYYIHGHRKKTKVFSIGKIILLNVIRYVYRKLFLKQKALWDITYFVPRLYTIFSRFHLLLNIRPSPIHSIFLRLGYCLFNCSIFLSYLPTTRGGKVYLYFSYLL